MTEKTETKNESPDEIIAEMHNGIHTGRADVIDFVNEILRGLADRLKVAYGRENHCEKRYDKDGNEMPPHCAFDSLKIDRLKAQNEKLKMELDHFRDATKMAGNTAALREALAEARKVIKAMGGYWAMVTLPIIDAALSAPPRNFGRFDDYHDAVDAWHREERCLGHHQDGGTCEKDPLASTLAPVCFARWLFAPVEQKGETK